MNNYDINGKINILNIEHTKVPPSKLSNIAGTSLVKLSQRFP